MLDLNIPLRAIQGILAIISIGLIGYVNSWYHAHTHPSSAPKSSAFLIFVACWTLLVLPYLFLNPPLSQTRQNKPSGRYFNKFAVLGLDALTCLLWFAAFIALSTFKHGLILCGGHVCSTMDGGVVVGALAWLLFLTTTILATLHVLRTRGSAGEGAPHKGWVGGQDATAQV